MFNCLPQHKEDTQSDRQDTIGFFVYWTKQQRKVQEVPKSVPVGRFPDSLWTNLAATHNSTATVAKWEQQKKQKVWWDRWSITSIRNIRSVYYAEKFLLPISKTTATNKQTTPKRKPSQHQPWRCDGFNATVFCSPAFTALSSRDQFLTNVRKSATVPHKNGIHRFCLCSLEGLCKPTCPLEKLLARRHGHTTQPSMASTFRMQLRSHGAKLWTSQSIFRTWINQASANKFSKCSF